MDLDQPLPKCKKCHGFSMDHLLQYGEYTSPLHTPKKHIKQSELPGNHLLTRPGKLTNKLLIEAYFTARDMFLSGRISKNLWENILQFFVSTLILYYSCWRLSTVSTKSRHWSWLYWYYSRWQINSLWSKRQVTKWQYWKAISTTNVIHMWSWLLHRSNHASWNECHQALLSGRIQLVKGYT